MQIIFLKPIFKERIWGGTKLRSVFGYETDNDHIGECWAISAHKNGANVVINGSYKGLSVDELYHRYKKELFNDDPSDKFPVLIKILDANDDLSIQVHPDDAYALKYEHDYGKTECWYVIDAKEHTKIVDGHHASSKTEFLDRIRKNDLSLWRYREIKKDDFISIPAKKVHAIGQGAFIYEVQQSSDTTYRIYDYNRTSNDGTKRELHLEAALDVVDIPSKDVSTSIDFLTSEDYDLYKYIKNEYFEVRRVDVKREFNLITNKYQLCSVLEGCGFVNGVEVKKGQHFIITGKDLEEIISFSGKMKVMLTQRP